METTTAITERAEKQYRAFADSLLAEAMQLREAGWTHWAAEVEAFAVLAEHAAWAERTNPKSEGLA